jgi:hypothetical protein
MSDIVERLRAGEPCGEISSEYACGVKTAESGCQCAMAADEIERLRALLMPKLLDENAPKDRMLIGVERPPYEDKTYYSMVQWREDTQQWMMEAGVDWSASPGQPVWAYCGVSHYIDPLELPGLPYWEGEDEEVSDE